MAKLEREQMKANWNMALAYEDAMNEFETDFQHDQQSKNPKPVARYKNIPARVMKRHDKQLGRGENAFRMRQLIRHMATAADTVRTIYREYREKPEELYSAIYGRMPDGLKLVPTPHSINFIVPDDEFKRIRRNGLVGGFATAPEHWDMPEVAKRFGITQEFLRRLMTFQPAESVIGHEQRHVLAQALDLNIRHLGLRDSWLFANTQLPKLMQQIRFPPNEIHGLPEGPLKEQTDSKNSHRPWRSTRTGIVRRFGRTLTNNHFIGPDEFSPINGTTSRTEEIYTQWGDRNPYHITQSLLDFYKIDQTRRARRIRNWIGQIEAARTPAEKALYLVDMAPEIQQHEPDLGDRLKEITSITPTSGRHEKFEEYEAAAQHLIPELVKRLQAEHTNTIFKPLRIIQQMQQAYGISNHAIQYLLWDDRNGLPDVIRTLDYNLESEKDKRVEELKKKHRLTDEQVKRLQQFTPSELEQVAPNIKEGTDVKKLKPDLLTSVSVALWNEYRPNTCWEPAKKKPKRT